MLSRETIEIFPSPLAVSEYIRRMGKEIYFNHTFYTFGKILLNLAAGNTTLRVDRLARALEDNFEITIGYSDIWKYEQYIRVGGVLLEMDEYLTVFDKKVMDNI